MARRIEKPESKDRVPLKKALWVKKAREFVDKPEFQKLAAPFPYVSGEQSFVIWDFTVYVDYPCDPIGDLGCLNRLDSTSVDNALLNHSELTEIIPTHTPIPMGWAFHFALPLPFEDMANTKAREARRHEKVKLLHEVLTPCWSNAREWKAYSAALEEREALESKLDARRPRKLDKS